MMQHTLAPAVLASLTAAGLVLTPVTAFAQDEGDASTLTVEQTAEPTDEPTKEAAPAPRKAQDTKDTKDTKDGSGADEGSGTADGGGDGEQSSSPEESAPTPTQTAPAEPTPEPSETPTEDPSPQATETEEPEEDDEAEQVDVTVQADDAPLSEVVYVTGEDAPAGTSISVSGLEDDEEYTLEVAGGPEDSKAYRLDVQDGAAQQSYTIAVPEGTDISALVGSRTVTVENSAGVSVATGSFEITDDTQDDAPAIDPELHVPGSIEVDDVMVPLGEEPGDRGLQIRASGLEPDTSYTFRVVPPAANPDLEAEFSATSDENGDASGSYFIEWSGDYLADALAGTYRVELLDGDDEVLDQADVEFVVGDADDDDDDQGEGGEDDGQDNGQDDGDQDQDDQDDDGQDEAADPSVTVDPKELSAAAFIDYDRGVQVTARDCTPGQTVDLEVFWPGTDDVAYADGIEADEEGTAGFSFYGTGDRASDYVGTWKVRISCGGETVSDTFTVTGQAGDDGRGGDELPRTGSEAGVLGIVAAGLMTVGAATVMITSRPRRRTDA